MNKKTVVMALSGGVDSTVSALLLKQQGYQVKGIHAVCYESSESYCTSEQDRLDAIKASKQLDIPLTIVDLQKEYKEKVIDYLVSEYKNNRTPNPDILCNRDIKFSLIMDYALNELHADYFATGHYAKIQDGKLMIPKDLSKDQTYFLWMVPKNRLGKIIFPLSDLQKAEVREVARKNNFINSDKKDSQGICFIGDVGISEFLKSRIISKKGDVIDINGKVIGTHSGFSNYTIGQRHGFTINVYAETPLYVVKKFSDTNIIQVASREYLNVNNFRITNLNIFNEDDIKIDESKSYKVRIRNLGELVECRVKMVDLGVYELNLLENIFAPAPGQSAVIYENGIVMAGGIII